METNEDLKLYLYARQVSAFRRLLWARLGAGLIVWVLIASLMSVSHSALLVGIGVIVVPAVWALRLERRAAKAFYAEHR